MSEEWIPFISNRNYEISNWGRIRTYYRLGGGGFAQRSHCIMKTQVSRYGYEMVMLKVGNKYKNMTIHRLVATHFLEPNTEKTIVNHKDGNKLNNNLSNLEWCTYSENTRHSYANGTSKGRKGEKHHLNKIKEEDVREIFRLRETGMTHKEISLEFNLSRQHVGSILNRERWLHIKLDDN